MAMKLRANMFQSTLRQDIAFFDETKNSTGALTSAISQKPQQINSAAGMTIAAVLQSIITLVVGIILAFVVSRSDAISAYKNT
jgi:ATP-binding cassette subfamily B (MDR/TAP) protein 1